MAVMAAPTGIRAALASRRGLAALVLLAVAAAIAVGILYRAGNLGLGGSGAPGSRMANAIGAKIGQGFNRLETVAGMLAGRSPGERAEGALASLKHKRVAILHERALPKIRRSAAAPRNALANIVAPPAGTTPIAPVTAAPLFNTVTPPPPTVATALAEAPPTIFPAMSPPGGGFIVPPIVTQVTPPVTPSVPPQSPPPAVPEPRSWAMLLIGFVMIGMTIRRGGRKALSSRPR